MAFPILVTRPLMPSLETYTDKIKTIWDTQWMTNNGTLCIELQKKLQARMQAPYFELFVNGHMALDIAIKAMHLTGEVITTPFSFASTTHALVLNGLKPVFCDIHPDDYTLDETKLEALITPQTSAILPVHVYGNPCNTAEIERIARKHHLKVLYDAAHAFDVTVNGKPLVLEGDMAMLSFHATKVFNTIEGGALILHSQEDAQEVCCLRNFGITGPETVPAIGLNAKMNEFSAAMGLCNLDLVDNAIELRSHLAEQYRSQLEKLPGLRLLDYDGMAARGIKTSYAYMPLTVKDCGFTRDELFDALAKQNVLTRKYFYPLITDYECYQQAYGSAEVPVAREAAASVLTLPISATTTSDEVAYVCRAIQDFYRQKNGDRS